jgi:hypothetical protein
MKYADGNSELVSGKHSITTPPRRNIIMTGAKYGGLAERIFKTHNMWYGACVGGPKYYAVNLILRLFLYRFLQTLSSESIHNNTNTQRTSPPWWRSCLPLQRCGFDDSMPPKGWAALHIYCPRLLSKD